MPETDLIDRLLEVEPGAPLDRIRQARPEARANSQRSYEALLSPVDDAHVSLAERFAVATFVARLHQVAPVADHYAVALAVEDSQLLALVTAEADRGVGTGPYGVYSSAQLAPESVPGPVFTASDGAAPELGTRLTAALEHAHLLVFRPREASAGALQRLLDAGWSTTGVVTLSQLVAFLSYQIRIVHGLAVLAATEA